MAYPTSYQFYEDKGMGEAKRRQQNDPTFGQPAKQYHYLLRVYRLTDGNRTDFIDPAFDLKSFDSTIPHTANEWQSYFFSINPDCALVDKASFNQIDRGNQHSRAMNVYIQKKIAKGLVIIPSTNLLIAS